MPALRTTQDKRGRPSASFKTSRRYESEDKEKARPALRDGLFLPQSFSDCGVEIPEPIHYSVFFSSGFFAAGAFIALGFQKSGSALIQLSST
jgi:hypothetical protein